MKPFARGATLELSECLAHFPAVVLTGPRQCGKTTLAQKIAGSLNKPTLYLDLESATDRRKLTDPNAFLDPLSDHLVILDEVQRGPDIFIQLRGIIDRRRTPGRFLLWGSASPLLLRQSCESLAGRVAHVELTPFRLSEVGAERIFKLWVRGGFRVPAESLHRLWQMLAHHHDQANRSRYRFLFVTDFFWWLFFGESVRIFRWIRKLGSGRRQVRFPRVSMPGFSRNHLDRDSMDSGDDGTSRDRVRRRGSIP